MKNIIYIGGFELPDKNAAAQRVMANAKALEKLGYSVIFIGVDKSLNDDTRIQNTAYTYQGIRVYNIPYPKGLIAWVFYLFSIKKYLQIFALLNMQLTSHIILYNFPSIPLLKLLKYSKKNKIKVLSDCTEWAITPKVTSARGLIKKWDTKLRMEVVHKKIDGLIVISKYLFDYYKSSMNNIQIIPPLVDLSDEKWNKKYEGKRLGKKLKFIYAGSPGTGSKDRLDKIIEAFSSVKEQTSRPFILTIVGLTNEQYLHNFSQKNIPENLKDHISFKGRLSHNEVIVELQNADFSIFFRDNNLINNAGFPTKFVESISCGTPVICNSTSNIQEYLCEFNLGKIVNFNSGKLLVSDLIHILNLDELELLKMKDNCIESNIFDYNSYLRLFAMLLNYSH